MIISQLAVTRALKGEKVTDVGALHVMDSPRDAVIATAQSNFASHIAKFGDHDVLGYLQSFWTWFGQVKKAEFRSLPIVADLIPETVSLALFADWGTGLYGAPAVARIADEFDIAVHLGDVYYSGTHDEYEERVAPYWPRKALSKALNGNHDMYSGGHGYFSWLSHIRLHFFRDRTEKIVNVETHSLLYILRRRSTLIGESFASRDVFLFNVRKVDLRLHTVENTLTLYRRTTRRSTVDRPEDRTVFHPSHERRSALCSCRPSHSEVPPCDGCCGSKQSLRELLPRG